MKEKDTRREVQGARPSEAWLKRFKKATTGHVLRGDYRSALEIAREALRLYPTQPECRFQYAKLLGDWADELPPTKREKLKAEALEILRSLIRSVRSWSTEERFRVSLNYYYQSEDFRGMYRYGRRLAEKGVRQGHYAMGLGAAYLALRAKESGANGHGKGWARKAIPAWKAFDLRKEDYYFPHYALAMAHAVEGEKDLALKSLQRAAKLSRRTVKDAEFSDVLRLIQAE